MPLGSSLSSRMRSIRLHEVFAGGVNQIFGVLGHVGLVFSLQDGWKSTPFQQEGCQN